MPRALCPHRGMPLDSSGKCPYHGLCLPLKADSFGLDATHRTDFDVTWCEAIEDDLGEKFFTYDFPLNAPPHLWMQNTMDWHHVPTVHKDTIAHVLDPSGPYEYSLSKSGSIHRIRVIPEVIERYTALCGDGISFDFMHAVEFPDLSVTSFLNVFYSFESVKPSGKQARVRTTFYTSKRNKPPRQLVDAAIDINKRLLNEDRNIVEAWAKTYEDVNHVNFLPKEQRIEHFLDSPYCKG